MAASLQSVHLARVRKVCLETAQLLPVCKSRFETASSGPIIYWMSRDQRAEDNWALLFAREVANQNSVPVSVVFNLLPNFLNATERQFSFLLQGLQETETNLRSKNIPFHLLRGTPEKTIPKFMKNQKSTTLITDFSPLRISKLWREDVRNNLPEEYQFFVVDAHNVVPAWVTSDKQEYAARTIRPKIHKNVNEFLVEFPALTPNLHTLQKSLPEPINWEEAEKSLTIDRTIKSISWAKPGASAAAKILKEFCQSKLKNYSACRNDPNSNALSNLSPYFHFGQLAPQRAILDVTKHAEKNSALQESAKAFVEEAMVRRELSDNYCFYQPNYDQITGASEWAQITLAAHAGDSRTTVYSLEEFESAATHSPFWNAMQTQLIREGKLHGYLRMMWAKNVLEWSDSPEAALRILIYLNDKFSIDGRDPNGYVGWYVIFIIFLSISSFFAVCGAFVDYTTEDGKKGQYSGKYGI